MKLTSKSDLRISAVVATPRPCCATESDIPQTRISVVDAVSGLYTVRSSSGNNLYSVDSIRGCCSCYVGAAGKLCKHASAVLLYRDAQICTEFNIVSHDTKLRMFKVGADWLLPLNAPATVKGCSVQSQQLVSSCSTAECSTDIMISADKQMVSFPANDMAPLDRLFAWIEQGLCDFLTVSSQHGVACWIMQTSMLGQTLDWWPLCKLLESTVACSVQLHN